MTSPSITNRHQIDRDTPVYNLIDEIGVNPFFTRSTEYPGYDGWYNNIGRPELGAIDTPLLRRWPAAYEDGVYEPSGSNRPNPLTLSDAIFTDTTDSKSHTAKNALMVFFGEKLSK